jgi:hypothetical protein
MRLSKHQSFAGRCKTMRPSKTSRLRLAKIASLLLRCNQVHQAPDMSSKMSTNTPLQVFPYFFFRHSLPVPSCQLQAPKASNSHVQCMSKLSADKITVDRRRLQHHAERDRRTTRRPDSDPRLRASRTRLLRPSVNHALPLQGQFHQCHRRRA